MTRRQTLNRINEKLQSAHQNKDIEAISYWDTIQWMAFRPSMKTWDLEQLEQQYEKTNEQHNIACETLRISEETT